MIPAQNQQGSFDVKLNTLITQAQFTTTNLATILLDNLPEEKDDNGIQDDSTNIKKELDMIDQHIATLVYELHEEKKNLVLDL